MAIAILQVLFLVLVGIPVILHRLANANPTVPIQWWYAYKCREKKLDKVDMKNVY